VEEGIVPGGGVALINAIPALDGDQDGRPASSHGRQASCAGRWKRRCARSPRTPARTATSSSRTCAGSRDREQNDAVGLQRLTEEYVNMVKAGIIDPAKVTRGALENAASIGR
jgi:chaperonin GroEL